MPFHLRSILLYHAMSDEGIHVLGFWDNDESLNGKSYNGLGITLPVSANVLKTDITIIICYQKYQLEIKTQLEALGYHDNLSAKMFSIYKNKYRLLNYCSSVNEIDLAEIKPQDISKLNNLTKMQYERCLWIAPNQRIPLAGLSPDNYCNAILEAVYKHYTKATKVAGRKVLLISNHMGYSGAPIALMNAAKALLDNGDIPIVLCKYSGNLLDEFTQSDITVLIDHLLPENEYFTKLSMLFDMVVINTAVPSSVVAINYLSLLPVPVMWWIHEAKHFYETTEAFPHCIGDNIHIYCAGEYAQKMFVLANIAGFRVDVKTLLYGIKEPYKYRLCSINMESTQKTRLKIMTIGTIEEIKGQDILCEAIRKLDTSVRDKCDFVFIGKPLLQDCRVNKEVLSLKHDFPESITLIDQLSRDEIFETISQCDCMICASRDDSMPIFIAEAMMFRKICICSENTGTAALIEHGENGFIYYNNDSAQLSGLIKYVVNNYHSLTDVGIKSRSTYDKYFNYNVFKQNFIEAVSNTCRTYKRQ